MRRTSFCFAFSFLSLKWHPRLNPIETRPWSMAMIHRAFEPRKTSSFVLPCETYQHAQMPGVFLHR